MLTVAAPGRREAPGPKETDIAFLLAQLGAFAAGQFHDIEQNLAKLFWRSDIESLPCNFVNFLFQLCRTG